jgi:hypothetical protein
MELSSAALAESGTAPLSKRNLETDLLSCIRRGTLDRSDEAHPFLLGGQSWVSFVASRHQR